MCRRAERVGATSRSVVDGRYGEAPKHLVQALKCIADT